MKNQTCWTLPMDYAKRKTFKHPLLLQGKSCFLSNSAKPFALAKEEFGLFICVHLICLQPSLELPQAPIPTGICGLLSGITNIAVQTKALIAPSVQCQLPNITQMQCVHALHAIITLQRIKNWARFSTDSWHLYCFLCILSPLASIKPVIFAPARHQSLSKSHEGCTKLSSWSQSKKKVSFQKFAILLNRNIPKVILHDHFGVRNNKHWRDISIWLAMVACVSIGG